MRAELGRWGVTASPAQRTDRVPAEGSGKVTGVFGDGIVRLDFDVTQRLVEIKAVFLEHDREVPPHRAEPLVSE